MIVLSGDGDGEADGSRNPAPSAPTGVGRARGRDPFTVTVPRNATPGDYVGGTVTTLTRPDTSARVKEAVEQALTAVR